MWTGFLAHIRKLTINGHQLWSKLCYPFKCQWVLVNVLINFASLAPYGYKISLLLVWGYRTKRKWCWLGACCLLHSIGLETSTLHNCTLLSYPEQWLIEFWVLAKTNIFESSTPASALIIGSDNLIIAETVSFGTNRETICLLPLPLR